MNKIYIAAFILSTALTLGHIFAGGAQYHAPAIASSWGAEEKAVYSILWNFVSLFLAANSFALLWAALQRGRDSIVLLVSIHYLLFAAVFLFYGYNRLGGMIDLPQWIIFLAISGLGLTGVSLRRKSSSNVSSE